ncbi:MAG TPA: MFS transporter [Acidimicrobiia bacterium]|jgi:predicted MFS family arabinose efflux permease
MTEIGERRQTRSLVGRHPQLAAVIAAEGMSGAGDAIFWVGLLVWLLDQPNGTSLVAFAAIARLGPRVVFGAAGGVFADRYDRRKLMVALDLARGLLMLALASLTSAGSPVGAVLAIVVVSYVLASPYRPALNAGIPLVVGERDATAANALDGAVHQISTFLGPLLGTGVLWLFGVPAAFVLNAITFGCSALLLSRVSLLGGPPPALHHLEHSAERWWGAFRAGITSVTHQAGLGLMTWLVFAFSVARGFELVLLVLVAQNTLALGSEGVGVLTAAIGVGALAMVPFVGRIATVRRPGLTVIASLLLSSIPLALLAVIEVPAAACLVLVAVGVGVVGFEVLSITLIQRLSRIDLLGRVFGIENMAVNAGKLVGATLAPVLVTALSLSDALLVAALVVTVSAVGAAPGLRQVARTALARRRELEPIVTTLARLDLFDGASQPALERVAGSVRPRRVPAGTMVIRQGDVPDNLYVIRTGTFDVIKDGVHVATISADDWFGEIGLLRQTPRTAAVFATAESDVWVIPGVDFLATINETALTPTALLDGMTARLAELAEVDPAKDVHWHWESEGDDPRS